MGWNSVMIWSPAMISSRPRVRRSSSRVRWRRLMNIASSRARWMERSARSMGSRYMSAWPSWKVSGAWTPVVDRGAGSASLEALADAPRAGVQRRGLEGLALLPADEEQELVAAHAHGGDDVAGADEALARAGTTSVRAKPRSSSS